MFTKILIANRGEIACRVAATAKRMGVRSVAVFSDADADSRHVQLCDEAVRLGPAAPKESYLRADLVIQAALATGAEAVHPGYGFLSENAAFAQACADAGRVFVGPPPSAIKAMGLKAEAKRLMAAAGVPLVPGYHGADQAPAVLKREAERIGFPVLIKASAGGGGKGMRVVARAADFDAALASCRREAAASFGDDAVLIERYVTRPRHIEIQVFADAHGHCVHLFERDCSVQRRHQKVLEEAPAPGLSEQRRNEMGAAAIAAARAVGYVGAGTVEFIAEPVGGGASDDLRFYFMEMNTRLQVEHPVTEAITGLDLVEWQLRVACGEPLPLRQEALRIHGHAIEARLCAENPQADFLPSVGRLDLFRPPPEAANFEPADVRIDAGVREGDAISPFYDPMIAKLIVWGEDRAQALARLDLALAQTRIVGVHTNVAFLRRVVASRSFAAADLDTALIERERAVLFAPQAVPIEIAVAAVVAHQLAAETALEGADPWSRRDGWRLHGAATRHFEWRIDGRLVAATLEHARSGMTLVIGDQRWPFAARRRAEGDYALQLAERRTAVQVHGACDRPAAVAKVFTVFAPDGSVRLEAVDPLAAACPGSAPSAGGAGLAAPMPGKVIAILVQAGDHVVQGQPLAVMEAMKMEHTIAAPHDGTVAEWLHGVGDAVREGADLLRLTPSVPAASVPASASAESAR